MSYHFPSLRYRLPLTALLLAVASVGAAQSAQDQPEPASAVAAVEIAPAAALPPSTGAAPAPVAVRQIDIGSATQALWALQRASVSPHPRHIDGEQASRSYQRYLKSFETAIPDQYRTGLELKK